MAWIVEIGDPIDHIVAALTITVLCLTAGDFLGLVNREKFKRTKMIFAVFVFICTFLLSAKAKSGM